MHGDPENSTLLRARVDRVRALLLFGHTSKTGAVPVSGDTNYC